MNRTIEAEYKLSKRIYGIILVSGLIWTALIFLAPLLHSFGGVFERISSAIYVLFSRTCHQDSARSFHILNLPLAVCSRCIAIYAGFVIGTVLYPFKYSFDNIRPPSLYILIVPLLLLLLDVALDLLNILSNTYLSRSVTGFLMGFALAPFIIPGFVKFFIEVHSFLRNKVSV